MTYSWLMCAARAVIVALLPITLLTPAQAGDAAARKVIGFSPDGLNFAFEQYSQFYDSTDMMARIQVMETQTDGSVKFTWFTRRTWGEDEPNIKIGRAAIAANAKPMLDRLEIAEPGTRFAGKPSMDLDEIGIYQMKTQPLATTQSVTLPDGRNVTLTISERPLGEASCDGAGGRSIKGNVNVTGITLQGSIDGAAPVTLQRDKELPDDRRCVTAYGIAEVYHHQARDGTQTLAVLVETVDANQFHAGPNRRFMAVTAKLPKL